METEKLLDIFCSAIDFYVIVNPNIIILILKLFFILRGQAWGDDWES